MDKHDDHNIEVPSGSLSLTGQIPTILTVWRYLLTHPLWMILAVSLIVFPPLIGYVLSGVWGILFGWLSGVASFVVGSKATIKVIEIRQG